MDICAAQHLIDEGSRTKGPSGRRRNNLLQILRACNEIDAGQRGFVAQEVDHSNGPHQGPDGKAAAAKSGRELESSLFLSVLVFSRTAAALAADASLGKASAPMTP